MTREELEQIRKMANNKLLIHISLMEIPPKKVIELIDEIEQLREFIVYKDLGMEFILTKTYKGKNDDTL